MSEAASNRSLDFLHDVTMRVTVEFGRSKSTVRELLKFQKGSVVELEKMSGEPLDVRLNGKLVARGEAVIVNDRFGVRVTEIVSPEDFADPLAGGDKM
jgi:flagellar motor switch protein FliN/FliY